MQTVPHQPWRNALSVGGLFLAIGGIGWAIMADSKAAFGNFVMRGDPGPFFLGELCLGAVLIAGVVLTAKGLVHYLRLPRGARPARKGVMPDWRPWRVPVLFVLSLLIMPWALTLIGAVGALGLFAVLWIFALLRQSGAALRPALIQSLAGGGATAGFVAIVFIRLLHLPLPT